MTMIKRSLQKMFLQMKW